MPKEVTASKLPMPPGGWVAEGDNLGDFETNENLRAV